MLPNGNNLEIIKTLITFTLNFNQEINRQKGVFSSHHWFIHEVIQNRILTYRYDPKTDAWTIVAPISSPRDAVGVAVLGDKLYAVGGYDGSQYLNEVECYDPQANDWAKVSI